MRVLLLHNRYRLEGGEERAVDDLEALLRARGHEVRRLERSSADVSFPGAARGLLSGGTETEAVTRAVRDLKADVVHAHNLHPLFGWRALAAAREAGARTVLHLHNFRLFCAISVAYRDGAPCFRCRGADTWPGLRLRCRGGVAEAAVYAAGLRRQQPRLFEHADWFLPVSQATGRQLVELGLPTGRVTVLPNFVPAGAWALGSDAGEGRFALVSGRLVEEKGFDTAIAAARAAEVPLVVAGAGPDEARLRGLAAGAEVSFTGWLASENLSELRRRAAVVMVPSRWEEPCPYSVLDAMADGIPVLASDRGGLPELVGAGLGLDPEEPRLWASELETLWRAPAARRRAGEDALTWARERFGEDTYYERLMDVYANA
jgi:glycosyltransferase involved in cell wall biosynthesis